MRLIRTQALYQGIKKKKTKKIHETQKEKKQTPTEKLIQCHEANQRSKKITSG